jgi:hypothetical protein
MTLASENLDAYHCCEGIRNLTPEPHPNRPGLSALAYRVGTHSSFKATMLARIAEMPSLGMLGTREDSDFTVALMDAWATVSDVLSFYVERIANEAFIRTATETRSIQELARSIGYEPQPGVAASTYLAFIVEDSPGGADNVPIPAGTRAQSIPDGDELPQTFETTDALLAHPQWNALRPRQSEPQRLTRDICSPGSFCTLYFLGTDTRLDPGDWVLLRAPERADPGDSGAVGNVPLQVLKVAPDLEQQHTRVEVMRPQPPASGQSPADSFPGAVTSSMESGPSTPVVFDSGLSESDAGPQLPEFTNMLPPPPAVFTEPFTLSGASAAALSDEYAWSTQDRALFERMHGLEDGQLAKYVNRSVVEPEPDEETGVFAMRVETAPFGHNAPRWETLPFDWRIAPPDATTIYEHNWDRVNVADSNLDSWEITREGATPAGVGRSYKKIYGESDQDNDIILLDGAFSKFLPESWIILKGSGNHDGIATFRVTKAEVVSRADFALNGSVTALTLTQQEDNVATIDAFRLRTTTIYAQSEALTLAGKPIDKPVSGDKIEFDRILEPPVLPGQPVIVSGTPTGVKDIIEHELAVVAAVPPVGAEGYTKLVFAEKLKREYQRASVTVNANVALATHGERRDEVLGGGDASRSFQALPLSHAPLTYTSSSVPGGVTSTLELRVNGLLWQEAANFFGLGPEDRRYVLHRDEQGKTYAVFGDGRTGKRLPTGFENVSVSYRSGLGAAGNLSAGKITILGSQPRYLREVNNHVPATGGTDPEPRSETQRNAPNSVRTFGRIVSLRDFEDFARAFAGVAKARAALLAGPNGQVVHLTIAGEGGASVPTDSALYTDLLVAMDRVRDPQQRLLVASYENLYFDITKIFISISRPGCACTRIT